MQYCSKCGSSNLDDSAYCARCGTPLELAPRADKAAPQEPQAPAQSEKTNVSMLWMILNIISTVLCCPGFLFSITGIVFAALGSESFKKGDEKDAKRKSMVSMILFIVSVVVGLAGWIAAILAFYVNAAGLYGLQ